MKIRFERLEFEFDEEPLANLVSRHLLSKEGMRNDLTRQDGAARMSMVNTAVTTLVSLLPGIFATQEAEKAPEATSNAPD